ncbi:unnamed protein product [Pleuronectes platessa]|uniref:Uncharacterized protein n=1 Tax=Pleuronectes platessa TaxID=8262 RepID=A0A9N7UJZ4_PLEPL|nr:unnamed protein product [Pleuronectes platessa]
MDTSSEGNGGAEGPCPGLDCNGCSDKKTAKGRFRQVNRGSWLRLRLPAGRAHSSLRSPPTPAEAGICNMVPPARSWEVVAKASQCALPAERRDSPSLRSSVALTLSLSMSLASTKAIWGAAESFSNKITLSICTLHGSDCGALRSPIPRLAPDPPPLSPPPF